MKDPESINQVIQLHPDYIGLIFYPPSPRYVVGTLDPGFIHQLPSTIKKAGVFVNEELEQVFHYGRIYGLDIIQLHGNESPQYCNNCRSQFTVVKTFAVSDEFDFKVLEDYKKVVDFFLFDTKTSKYGGSGRKFNWELLKNYSLDIPYFLSGGIGVEDIEDLLKTDIPPFFALDINSKVEIAPGKKDVDKVQQVKDKLNGVSIN